MGHYLSISLLVEDEEAGMPWRVVPGQVDDRTKKAGKKQPGGQGSIWWLWRRKAQRECCDLPGVFLKIFSELVKETGMYFLLIFRALVRIVRS
jgi:hypothetical protein